MNVLDMDIVYAARGGELEPLAKYLEEGNYITEEMVEFLVLHLRGGVESKRGNKRTFSQYSRDQELRLDVGLISFIGNVSAGKALQIYCKKNDVNFETAKSAYKRALIIDPRFE